MWFIGLLLHNREESLLMLLMPYSVSVNLSLRTCNDFNRVFNWFAFMEDPISLVVNLLVTGTAECLATLCTLEFSRRILTLFAIHIFIKMTDFFESPGDAIDPDKFNENPIPQEIQQPPQIYQQRNTQTIE